ncbi:MAG: type II toxin-antitoxin system YoeB family toxin [Crocinitomicaceae bacterium]|nr:type II toxin-antitoxin system YoeB family toxin [Crocinitomicaceae bacterium]
MEAFFNELSVLPQCLSIEDARSKIIGLLNTMKSLNPEKYNVLRAPDNFYAMELFSGYSFASFVHDAEVSPTLRILLQSLVKNPFILNSDSYEAEAFIMNSFETNDCGNKIVSPEGIAVAYVHSSPTVSVASCSLFMAPTLILKVTNDENQSFTEDVQNFWSPKSVETWVNSLTGQIKLNSKANVLLFFPIGKYEFDTRAMNEFLDWYRDDARYQKRIKELIFDIDKFPFVGGKGLTETLQGGKASKRIVKKDRVVYTYTKTKTTIHSCKGHYDDK